MPQTLHVENINLEHDLEGTAAWEPKKKRKRVQISMHGGLLLYAKNYESMSRSLWDRGVEKGHGHCLGMNEGASIDSYHASGETAGKV